MGQADVPWHALLGKILSGSMTVAQGRTDAGENLFLRAYESKKGGFMDAFLPKSAIPQDLVAGWLLTRIFLVTYMTSCDTGSRHGAEAVRWSIRC